MKLLNAEYGGAVDPKGTPPKGSGPEVGFIGRSNVGKSSMINALLMRRLARTSSTPGATRMIHRYRVDFEAGGRKRWMIFSDFPGFGYSKVARETYEAWEGMVERYITGNEDLKRVIWLFDVRRNADDLDRTLISWLAYERIPFDLVLTKVDKEGIGFAVNRRRAFADLPGESEVFLFSSKTGYGRRELLSHILSLVL